MAISDDITFINPVADDDDQSEGDKNQVLKWVLEVDKHIEKSSMEILKLGLRTDLTQAEMERETESPSDLYHKLKRKYSNEETLLSRFIYALERLGHRRHGLRAVRKLDMFGINKPKQFNPADEITDPAELRLFNFYQCLVEICRDLDVSHYKRLLAYSTETFLGGVNPKMIKTPCELFTMLFEQKIISEDDQTCLVLGLEITGASRCTDHIHNYRHQNDLPETEDSKYSNSTRRSNASSKTNESSRYSTLRQDLQNDGYRQLHAGDTHIYSTKKSHWKLCFISVLLILVLLVGVLAVAVLGVNVTSLMMNHSNTAVYHDNATVILTELNHFFTQSITVTQDTSYPGDIDHEIGVYIVDSKCSDLPILEFTNVLTGTDLSSINKTTFYLLAGSSITYSVCESTIQAKKIGRLEVVVLDNLKSAESPENIRNSFYKFAYFNTHKSDEPSCDLIKHSFEANGYYTIVFLLPPYQAQFEYNVTHHIKAIDFNQLSAFVNHTLYSDKDSHKFPLGFNARRSCSLATIEKGAMPYLHIQFEMEGHYDMWVTILLGVICGLIVIVSIAVMFVLICCCHLHSCKKQGRYNID